MRMGKLYSETSIESLNPRDFTRLKPGVYAGDCTYATQLLIEIISNAVDEPPSVHLELGVSLRISYPTI